MEILQPLPLRELSHNHCNTCYNFSNKQDTNMVKKIVKTAKTYPRKALVFGVVVILVTIAAVIYLIKHTDNSRLKPAPTTSKLPSAQSSFTHGGQKRLPASTPIPNVSSTDNNGAASSNIPPASQWTTSKDGSSIVLYSPANNSVFSSGETIFGTAKSSTVSYQVEDDVSGVIAQGTANVVNGQFSITFKLATTAKSGKIDIFNQDSSGVVSNLVQVSVTFK
jgi:hypothetical protein